MPAVDRKESPESRIDALMGAYEGDVPGACVAVLHDGVPIVQRAYGLANIEDRIAATSATNYRLASITKQFTAAAVLLLAEDGGLSIDDPVRRWLPTLSDAADGVTLRHLLTHRSGVVDYEYLIPEGVSAQLHDADVLHLLEAQRRRYFPAGTQYRYSNTGYALLALIIGRASGKDFASFVRERIFGPLNMQNTMAFEEGISVVADRAFGYSADGESWMRTDQSLTSATLGDGGIYSSVEDLAKWDAALGDDRLLRPASLRLAFQPSTETDDSRVQYGFGWFITDEARWHSGESLGFRNVILRHLERRLTVIVLTNRNDPSPYPMALEIARLFLPDAAAPAADAAAGAHGAGPDSAAWPLP
jgi:CubicO group peptidase (beta-lactamase class C family)